MAGWMIALVIFIICFFNIACLIVVGSPRGAVLLAVSNRREKVARHDRPQMWFAWDLIEAKDLYAAPAIGTQVLALYRAFQFCVFLFVILYGNIVYTPAGGGFFLYFTNWTFMVFGLTALSGSILTTREWRKQRRPAIPCIQTSQPVGIAPGWSVANRCYHLLFETACCASIMLTMFYWLADYVPGSSIRLDNPFKHGVSAALMLLDLAVSRLPLISFHIQVVVGYGTLYMGFLWFYHLGTGVWVYRALDWTKPLAPVYYTALPLLLMFAFSMMFLVAALREVALARRCTAGCDGCCCFCSCTSDDADAHTVQGQGCAASGQSSCQPSPIALPKPQEISLRAVTSPDVFKASEPSSPTVAILMR